MAEINKCYLNNVVRKSSQMKEKKKILLWIPLEWFVLDPCLNFVLRFRAEEARGAALDR